MREPLQKSLQGQQFEPGSSQFKRQGQAIDPLTDLGVITFFRTIFPAKPSQIENEPENSPLNGKESLLPI
jgi:hypothetical protein